MQNSKIAEIGEVESISGGKITVRLFDNIRSNMPILDGVVYRVGQVGSFVKIPLGYALLFGIVTQVGSAAIPDNLRESFLQDYSQIANTRWVTIALVGEQVGKRFDRGVTQYPSTGDKVHLVSVSDLELIYGGSSDESTIVVGNISVSESLAAKLDLNKLVTRHSAIVGSTGSGKSNTVSVLIEAIAIKKFASARVLVVDPHGEYRDALSRVSKVLAVDGMAGSEKLVVPYWALPFAELMNLFSGNISEANREYVREKIVDAKILSARSNGINVEEEIITADSPIPFSLKKLWFDLDDFERQTYNENGKVDTKALKSAGNPEALVSSVYEPAGIGNSKPFLNNKRLGLLGFLESVRNRLKDRRYHFLFSPDSYSPNLQGKVESDLDSLLKSWLGGTQPITILDLSGVPNDIMASISGTLLKIVYDALFWGLETKVGGKQQPLLIVLEEAHSYLRAGEGSIASRTVQTIAKEGRKYGVGLMLVTQRPSELDETVLSQCGTIIALRMNNSRDRGHIRSALQDELQTMVDLLPTLRTGEGLISGEAVRIPSRVKFFKTTNAPKSSDPMVTAQWQQQIQSPSEEYVKLLRAWRNQNYRIEEV